MSRNELKYNEQIRELAALLCADNDNSSLSIYIDQFIGAIHSQRYEDSVFKRQLRDSILPKWIQRLDDEQQLSNAQGQQLGIGEHCHRLAQVVLDIELESKVGRNKDVAWSTASDWLGMAASIRRVSLITAYYDSSLMYCGAAMEYEDERSRLMSQLVYQLAIFNFVWGGFETILKLISPPNVPKSIKARSSRIDSAIFYLKNEYEPLKTVAFYDETVYSLRKTLERIPFYGNFNSYFSISSLQGVSGIGINVVRHIRNHFAHGTSRLPFPGDENEARSLDAILVELSTRVVLHTIQMLLLANFKGRYFGVELDHYHDWGWWKEDEWEEIEFVSIDRLLRSLHINKQPVNENQLSLFRAFEKERI